MTDRRNRQSAAPTIYPLGHPLNPGRAAEEAVVEEQLAPEAKLSTSKAKKTSEPDAPEES